MIDVVVKVGGSLAQWRGLGPMLDALATWRDDDAVLVIPGGGPFADLVRAAYRRHRLTARTAHRMAILSMDQFGLVLCDLASLASPVTTLTAGRLVLRAGRIPVLLPSRMLLRHEPFEPSWGVTSDSIAAYLAGLAGARSLVLLKDVDGVYARDPRQDPLAPLLPRLPLSRLGRYRCVDREFPRWARGLGACWIINGRKPARLKEWLQYGRTLGTCVEMG